MTIKTLIYLSVRGILIFVMAFLAFEGVDGSGKTTLIKNLSSVLQERNVDFIFTREPGGTEVGREIRSILLKKRRFPPSPSAETLLYYADRKQNVEQIIKPALKAGKWVLSDRYWASTAAFQCGGRGEDPETANFLKKRICGNVQPDLWILLDLPVQRSLQRVQNFERENPDRFETENTLFHQRVRDYYLRLAQEDKKTWIVLNGAPPPEDILKNCLTQLEKRGFLTSEPCV